MKFKYRIGDRVYSKEHRNFGKILEREELSKGYNCMYKVSLEGTKWISWISEKSLKRPRILDTKIARKLYKGRIKRVEKGWIYLND